MKLKEIRILDAEGARYACIANGYCTRCGAQDPNAATQEPTQEPTATEAPAPDAPADSGTSGSGDTPDWASENSDSTPEA